MKGHIRVSWLIAALTAIVSGLLIGMVMATRPDPQTPEVVQTATIAPSPSLAGSDDETAISSLEADLAFLERSIFIEQVDGKAVIFKVSDETDEVTAWLPPGGCVWKIGEHISKGALVDWREIQKKYPERVARKLQPGDEVTIPLRLVE